MLAPLSHKHFAASLAFGISMLAVTQAFAQTVPNSARPEQIERRYQIQERPAVGGAPLISVPDEGIKQLKSDITFTLKSIKLDGNTTYSDEELAALYADKIGKKMSLADLNAVAAKITAHYRNNGYILSRAIIPPQRIDGGAVTIRIIEGFASDVRIEGDTGGEDSVINRYAQKIRRSNPLNAADLERYLLLIEDLPGVEARAVLRPSPTTPNASEVIINVTQKSVEGSAFLDNRGSRYIGPYQAGATVAGNNLFGLNEQTQLRVINSIFEPDELQYGDIRHEEQLGSEGTKLVFSASYSRTRPGSSVEILDFDGQSTSFSAGLAHPIIRSRRDNWFVTGDFTARRVSVAAADTNIYEDYLRVLTLGTSYDFIDDWQAINRMEINLGKGFALDTDNDGLSNSRTNGNPSFVKIYGNVTRVQPIDGPWTAEFSAAGQYSSRALFAAEEFVLGGPKFGSAYDSAELSGDAGLAGRLELQYSEALESQFLTSYQLYSFYDVGRVWNRDITPGSEDEHNSLASAGIGTRFNINASLSGGAELALPLTRDVAAYGADGSAPRGYFNLLYRF